MITSLRAASRTIADVLQSRLEADSRTKTLFGVGGTMRVYLNTPTQMTGQRRGVSVWLYRIVRDEATLNRPPERISPNLLRPLPLPVRLHYLITPITAATTDDALETEQVILGKVLQCFHSRPQLHGTDLSDDLAGTDGMITMRLESLTVDELSRIWDSLEAPYSTSLTYEATVIDVDIDAEPELGPPVRVPVVDTGIRVGAL